LTPKYEVFCTQVEKKVRKVFHDLLKKSEAAEQAVLAKSLRLLGGDLTEEEEIEETGTATVHWFEVELPRSYQKRFLIKYSILSWYLPVQTGFELREILQKRALEKQYIEIASYCYSKECCLRALYMEIDLRHNDLFGNLLKEPMSYISRTYQVSPTEEPRRVKFRVADSVILKLRSPRRARPKVYRRGYNDHGSTTPDDKKGRNDFRNDYTSTQIQRLIELRRTILHLQISNRILEILAGLD